MDEEEGPPAEQYQLHLWMEGPKADDRSPRYSEEHWFVERPETDIVLLLFADAKRAFSVLYPGVDPADFSVAISRLRPADNFRPDLRRMMEE
jgi:hypothetical protein